MTSFIPALLVKLTLILALGIVIAATFRAAAPSLRHLILFAAISCSLALPIVMLLTPRWDAPILPAPFALTLAPPDGSPLRSPASSGGSSSLGDALTSDQETNASEPGSALTAAVIDVTRSASAPGIENIAALLPILWALGVIGVLAWLTIGRVRLRRISRTSWPLNDADWRRILDEERREAGVDKTVRLFSSSVVSTPLTWGSGAPVILLPEDALDWPEAHRRIVLRHELAHVARGDARSQLVAGLACALYWFHPLIWIAERRLRAECERACDDRVVSLGTPAPEYAAHLLEVARSARAFGAPGFLSVAMARPSQLEGRLLAVLNGSRRRVSLSRGARRAAVTFSALVLLPLAAFRAVPKPNHPAQAKADQSAPVVAAPLSSSRSSGAIEPRRSAMNSAVLSMAGATANATTSSDTDKMSASLSQNHAADTTFQLSVPARSGGTLNLDLKAGGDVTIRGWDRSEVAVHASLGGRNWRETRVTLRPSDGDATLTADFTTTSNIRSTSHHFNIQVPRNFDIRIRSSGGSISIEEVNGLFTGQTGGGAITIQKANGNVDIRTGGGEIYVSNSNLNGSVSTGGGLVRIVGVNGNLSGHSGGGPVIYTNSNGGKNIGTRTGVGKDSSVSVRSGSSSITIRGEASVSLSNEPLIYVDGVRVDSSGRSSSISSNGVTTTYINDGVGKGSGFGTSGIRMNTAGGPLSLASAPNGARLTTGGGQIRIGPSGGQVYASTGGGDINIGPARGSVEAHTGGGDVTIELEGPGTHSVEVTTGRGEVVLVLPADINATLELETAYTNNLGHKTRIESDWPLTPTETSDWDASQGTPRRYVRVRQNIGRGGGVLRVRTVNGNVVLKRAR